jgi:hypothetical protein
MRHADHDDDLRLRSMSFYGLRVMYHCRVSVDDDGDSSEISEIPV